MDIQLESNHFKWVENLALEEINIEESGIISMESSRDQQAQMEESSIELMDDLRELFEIYVSKFNQLRASAEQDQHKTIKMFKISNSVNDFMLFRNSLKLAFTRKEIDTIAIGFLSHRTATQGEQVDNFHLLKADLGPFNEVQWKFQGENINKLSLVKHFLTEFIRTSSQ